MKSFEFASASRIIFGVGRARELGTLARSLGMRAMVLTGSNPERVGDLIQLLGAAGCDIQSDLISGEPTIELVERLAGSSRAFGAEFVVGIGGGSVIDAAKAVAALATHGGPALRYLEVIGEGQPLDQPPLPVLAVPTTSGTGSEVTRNAVLHSREHQVKVSLRHPGMLPKVALVDPELTLSLPRELTAATGMDALTQLIEPFLSCRANPLTDAICREAIPRALDALEQLSRDESDSEARIEMAFASLCSGLALANSGLGAVHGMAAPIGGRFSIPHGSVCAALLPGVLRANLAAVDRAEPILAARFIELACLLTAGESANPASTVEKVESLRDRFNLPKLSELGVSTDAFEWIAERSLASSSMKGNPVQFSRAELVDILLAS